MMINDDSDQHTKSGNGSSMISQAHADRATSATSSQTLAGFWNLPPELLHRIISLACGPPAIHRNTIVGRSGECATTMLSLLKAAKGFSSFIIPLLYRHVRLTRPSALRSFLQALLSRPSIGEGVHSLHLGPEKELPLDWWPLRLAKYGDTEPQSITLLLGGEGVPWRNCPRHELHLDPSGPEDVRAKALKDALAVATQHLGVTLSEPPRQRYGTSQLRPDERCVSILELQAIMELYYFRLLRCDESAKAAAKGEAGSSKRKRGSGSSDGETQPTYPRLSLEPSTLFTCLPSEESGDKVFLVSESQIEQRLASSGSPIDDFDHPYLFARSGAPWIAEGPRQHLRLYHGTQGWVGRTKLSLSTYEAAGSTTPPPTPSWDSLSLATPPTVSNVVANARCLIALAPRVHSLSLTGLFHGLAAGEHLAALDQLRSLTIGPFSEAWIMDLKLERPEFDQIVRLRLCQLLSDEEAEKVSGDGAALPQLRELQWSIQGDCGAAHQM